MRPLVIIPVFNEEVNLGKVLEDILNLKIFDILVVDDGSQDLSSEIAKSYGVAVIRNEINRGKGAALRRGFKYGLKNGYELVITMDGDGQHRSEDVLAIYNKWLNSEGDIIIGNRMWNPAGMPWIRKFTNKIMSELISYLTDTKIPDSQCGLKLIKRKVLDEVNISSNKFEVESEILLRALRRGYRIDSINISSVYFSGRKSNIRPLRDTIRFLKFVSKAIFKR